MALAPVILTSPHLSRTGFQIELVRPDDSQAQRNKLSRLATFLLTTAAVLVSPTTLFGYWGYLTGSELATQAGMLVGFVAGGVGWASISGRLLLYNAEWRAYVSNNPFGGKNIPYGPGLHLTHLWERRNKAGNYSLERITREFTLGVQTKTSRITVDGFFQYAIDMGRVVDYIGSDPSTIEQGLVAYVESFLTQRYAKKTGEQSRTSIDEINAALANEFMGVPTQNGTSVTKFEERYGIIVVSIVIASIQFPDDVQKTRDAIDEAKRLHEVVARLHGYTPTSMAAAMKAGDVSHDDYQKMLNRAMAVSKNAELNINVLETDFGVAIAAIYELITGRKLPGGKAGGTQGSPRRATNSRRKGTPT